MRSSSSRGQSRPCSAPPRHLIAAAEITPSGVPPIPISTSTPVPGLRGDRRCDVAVPDQVDPRARLAQLGDQRLVPVPLEHDDRQVLDVHALGGRDAADVLGRRGVDVDRVAASGPTAILSM